MKEIIQLLEKILKAVQGIQIIQHHVHYHYNYPPNDSGWNPVYPYYPIDGTAQVIQEKEDEEPQD